MALPDARAVAVRFNERINARDLDGLAELMTDDHTFIDSAGSTVAGKSACLAAWGGFFAAFPDYHNVFTSVSADDDLVLIEGRSLCSEPELAGPARWSAQVRGERIASWRVYESAPPSP